MIIAAFSASLMLIVASVESLPLRDPDARYVGSPLALIGVIAGIFLILDLVPRSWRHSRETGTSLPASFVGVFEERWWGRRGLIVIVALLSFYVTYISYRNLKSFLPFVTDANFDGELLSSERWLFFGNDPAEFLHNFLGTGFSAEFLSAVYLAFLTFVPISLGDRADLVEPPACGDHVRQRALDLLDPGSAFVLHPARARPGLR